MHLAVLMTNTDVSEFAQRHPRDGEKYAALIASVRPDWQVTSFDVKDGVFPPDIAAFDGVIVTGSPASVRGGLAWVTTLLDQIRVAYAAEVPIFGACFGHQAVAVALGGEVSDNPGGWSFGLTEMDVVERPGWYLGPDRFRQYTAHVEQVTRLPEGAAVIFETPATRIGGFVCGDRVYTTQNHPEMTSDFMAALIEELHEEMPEAVTQQARESMTQTADTAMFAESIARFFEGGVPNADTP